MKKKRYEIKIMAIVVCMLAIGTSITVNASSNIPEVHEKDNDAHLDNLYGWNTLHCYGVLIGTISNVNRFDDRLYISCNVKKAYCKATYVTSDHAYGEIEGWLEPGDAINICKLHRIGYQGIIIGALSRHFICVYGCFDLDV